jgi:hypothetical protein
LKRDDDGLWCEVRGRKEKWKRLCRNGIIWKGFEEIEKKNWW